MNIKDLKRTGQVTLSYPADLREAVERVILSWKAFCTLPDELKKGFSYSNGGAGVGYELKDGSGNKGDRKENFDVALGGIERLKERAAALSDASALDFVEGAADLVNLVKPSILEFANQTGEEYGLEGFADEVVASSDAFFVRFIHYFSDAEPGTETATAHVDQSGFTFHLFESAPGLQCYTYDREWQDMPVSDGQTVIIPSMQMQLRSRGEIKALTHRVIATAETYKTGRFSAVCFVQLKNTAKYNKDGFGRLQEKEPGFNYGMPFGEFEKMFK